MKLVTKEIEKLLEKYPERSQEMEEDPLCIVKFFVPVGRGTWYVMEAQPIGDGDYLFFGYVESPIDPLFDELGSFTLNQLKSIKLPFGLGIERDLYFEPKRLSEIKEGNR